MRVERQDTYEQLNREIHTIIKEEARLEETIMQKEKSLETLQLDLKNDQTQLDSYKNELKTPFSQSLSKAELARLEVITKELAGLESSLQEASVKRVEVKWRRELSVVLRVWVWNINLSTLLPIYFLQLDEKIKILNLTLNQNLKRRRNDAAAKLDDISLTSSDGSNPELDSRRNELTLLQRQLNEVSKRIEGKKVPSPGWSCFLILNFNKRLKISMVKAMKWILLSAKRTRRVTRLG